MSNAARTVVYVILAVVGVIIAVNVLSWVLRFALHAIFSLLFPIAVVLGIGYVIYLLIGKKALGGGGRSLP